MSPPATWRAPPPTASRHQHAEQQPDGGGRADRAPRILANPVVGSMRRFARGAGHVALQPFQLVLRPFQRAGRAVAQLSGLLLAGCRGLSHQLLNVVQYVLHIRNQLVPGDRFHGVPPNDELNSRRSES
jgi:hypothetical protein